MLGCIPKRPCALLPPCAKNLVRDLFVVSAAALAPAVSKFSLKMDFIILMLSTSLESGWKEQFGEEGSTFKNKSLPGIPPSDGWEPDSYCGVHLQWESCKGFAWVQGRYRFLDVPHPASPLWDISSHRITTQLHSLL